MCLESVEQEAGNEDKKQRVYDYLCSRGLCVFYIYDEVCDKLRKAALCAVLSLVEAGGLWRGRQELAGVWERLASLVFLGNLTPITINIDIHIHLHTNAINHAKNIYLRAYFALLVINSDSTRMLH